MSGSFGSGRWAASVLCLVEWCSAALNVRENCVRISYEGGSGESKNWPGKLSDEPNTVRVDMVLSSSLAAEWRPSSTHGRWSVQLSAAQWAQSTSLQGGNGRIPLNH